MQPRSSHEDIKTMNSTGDDEMPQLSSETMNALMEFYEEQEERERKIQEIEDGNIPNSFEENWNMSQFWYTEETAERLAEGCLRSVNHRGPVACVSTPTLFRVLKEKEHSCTLKVLEYDRRFAVYRDDFVFYDFKDPLRVPRDLREKFDLVVIDPPYLSQDCLTKTAVTVKFLMKADAKIIVCTGAIMEDLAKQLLGVERCQFEVKHQKSLSNPFMCFANFNFDDFLSVS